MIIHLSPESAAIIEELMASGKYATSDAVVEAAIAALRHQQMHGHETQSSAPHVNPLMVEKLGDRNL